jgi:hypothetical protein
VGVGCPPQHKRPERRVLERDARDAKVDVGDAGIVHALLPAPKLHERRPTVVPVVSWSVSVRPPDLACHAKSRMIDTQVRHLKKSRQPYVRTSLPQLLTKSNTFNQSMRCADRARAGGIGKVFDKVGSPRNNVHIMPSLTSGAIKIEVHGSQLHLRHQPLLTMRAPTASPPPCTVPVPEMVIPVEL